mmetsp:Transcript_4960/g.11142  ORF Transcript_4960/g.11142 Transcript_4960/m.11142 type:complete len:86 (+) Transcript_4960:183-440(+)
MFQQEQCDGLFPTSAACQTAITSLCCAGTMMVTKRCTRRGIILVDIFNSSQVKNLVRFELAPSMQESQACPTSWVARSKARIHDA